MGTVLITGASGGLGARLVEGLLQAGVTNLACHFRSKSADVGKILKKHGLDAERHLFQADLTDQAAVAALAKSVAERFEPIWGVVNLAGESSNAVSWKLTLAEFMRILNANLVSTFLVTREFLPGMRERGGGRIINVSSVVAHTGVAGASHYCAAKAGIEGFTRAVALEVASKCITVNSVALGYFDQGIIASVPTDLLEIIKSRVPAKRLGRAEELTPLVRYLLSPEAEFMTGQVLHLNGGFHL